MFTINTRRFQRNQKKINIVVNGQTCICNKSIAEEISPIIQKFYEDNNNENSMFETEIPYNHSLSDSSAGSLNSICAMISKIFSGFNILCQKEDLDTLLLIGKHFGIQEILSKIEKSHQNLEKFLINLKNNTEFTDMIKLEKLLLFEVNDTNVEAKINENELLIKRIPVNCFFHFVIHICKRNLSISIVNPNELIIKIILNVDKIVPETLSYFMSFMFHKFVLINSKFKSKYISNQYEVNSMIHYIISNNLIENLDLNTKIIREECEFEIPKDLAKYYIKQNGYFELDKKNIIQNTKEIIFGENTMSHSDSFINFIRNDDIVSFQENLASTEINVRSNIKHDITNRIPFLNNDEGCSMIELSAFLGAIKCFTYLFNLHVPINKSELSNFAVAGGNLEIIHICEREECVFNERTLDISIGYHRHQITKWLIKTKNVKISETNLRTSIINYSIKTMIYLLKKGININKTMFYICESNNLILFKWFNYLFENMIKINLLYKYVINLIL